MRLKTVLLSLLYFAIINVVDLDGQESNNNDMVSISNSFKAILDKQAYIGYDFPDFINVGADTDIIDSYEKRFGFQFSNEIRELYSYANGTDFPEETPLGKMGLIPIHRFLSLEDAHQYYNQSIVNKEIFTNHSKGIKPGDCLFPFLEDGSGNCYWIDLNIGTDYYGRIYFTNSWGDEPDYVFTSLSNLFQVIRECYDTGLFFIDSDGYLDEEEEGWEIVAKKYEPELDYWDDYK